MRRTSELFGKRSRSRSCGIAPRTSPPHAPVVERRSLARGCDPDMDCQVSGEDARPRGPGGHSPGRCCIEHGDRRAEVKASESGGSDQRTAADRIEVRALISRHRAGPAQRAQPRLSLEACLSYFPLRSLKTGCRAWTTEAASMTPILIIATLLKTAASPSGTFLAICWAVLAR